MAASLSPAKALVFVMLVMFGAGLEVARGGPTLPAFSPSNFAPGAPIDNPYYPLVPGRALRYAGNVTDPDTGKTVFEISEDAVTNRLGNIGGVMARAVHSRVLRHPGREHDRLVG